MGKIFVTVYYDTARIDIDNDIISDMLTDLRKDNSDKTIPNITTDNFISYFNGEYDNETYYVSMYDMSFYISGFIHEWLRKYSENCEWKRADEVATDDDVDIDVEDD